MPKNKKDCNKSNNDNELETKNTDVVKNQISSDNKDKEKIDNKNNSDNKAQTDSASSSSSSTTTLTDSTSLTSTSLTSASSSSLKLAQLEKSQTYPSLHMLLQARERNRNAKEETFTKPNKQSNAVLILEQVYALQLMDAMKANNISEVERLLMRRSIRMNPAIEENSKSDALELYKNVEFNAIKLGKNDAGRLLWFGVNHGSAIVVDSLLNIIPSRLNLNAEYGYRFKFVDKQNDKERIERRASCLYQKAKKRSKVNEKFLEVFCYLADGEKGWFFVGRTVDGELIYSPIRDIVKVRPEFEEIRKLLSDYKANLRTILNKTIEALGYPMKGKARILDLALYKFNNATAEEEKSRYREIIYMLLAKGSLPLALGGLQNIYQIMLRKFGLYKNLNHLQNLQKTSSSMFSEVNPAPPRISKLRQGVFSSSTLNLDNTETSAITGNPNNNSSTSNSSTTSPYESRNNKQ